MGTTELRVKIKSLAAEARFIALEERRALALAARASGDAGEADDRRAAALAVHRSLREHRTGVVRETAREALLAYGFLRDRPYARLEPCGSSAPDWDGVWRVVGRFAPGGPEPALTRRWEAWRAEADLHRQG